MLAKSKLSSVEVIISKAIIDSNINHDEFVLIYNMREEYDDMKEEILTRDLMIRPIRSSASSFPASSLILPSSGESSML